MRGCTVALALWGCGFSSSAAPPVPDAGVPASDASPDVQLDARPDASIDAASVDAASTEFCAGTLNRVCVEQPPSNDVTLTTQTIDTFSSSLCAVYTATPAILACVIVGRSITIPTSARVTVTGTRPLILFADTITITGTLDAASRRGGLNGPAADSSLCATNFTNPTTGGGRDDGGGGWGGSFGGKGGAGGAGGENGAPGVAPDAIGTTLLHGGCGGGAGAGTGGVAGHGGGAVSLIAKQSLVIDGSVNASGSSGDGGTSNGGGGGGGSGGMIVLDAATVNLNGQCFANGGGAGEGANGITPGADGKDPTAPAIAAPGGTINTAVGGDGGSGGIGSPGPGAPGVDGINAGGNAVGGGGGGGGGVGIIKLFATIASGTTDPLRISPPPT